VSYAAHGGQFLSPTCFDSTSTWDDIKSVAPIDSHRNAEIDGSTDGSCTNFLHLVTLVQAADSAAASAKCVEFEGAGSFATGNMVSTFNYTTAPSDWWVCGFLG